MSCIKMNTQQHYPRVVNHLNFGAPEYNPAMPHTPVHRPLRYTRPSYEHPIRAYKTRYCDIVRCNGVGCTFAHSPEELSLGLKARQRGVKTLCRYGEKCRRGTHCKFIHPQPIRGTSCQSSTPAATECHYFLPLFMLESGEFSRFR